MGKPDCVKAWEDSAPKCCWTCVKLSGDYCLHWKEEVPTDVKELLDKCPHWKLNEPPPF